MKRNHWQREIARLDPETQYEEIARIAGQYEFAWDSQQALSFALFRTYAVPSIGGLLFDTGEFIGNVQKRHDDTAILLERIVETGLESPDGRAGVRRMNQMHGSYNISNDDMRYVLSTFVVTPARWIAAYGWREVSEKEKISAVRYYQRLGRLMGIKDIPGSYEEFCAFMDSYEREKFVFDPKCRAVADSTLDLFVSFYPKPMRGLMRQFSIALLDDHLRETFRYKAPPAWFVRFAHFSLVARGKLVRFLPPRRKPSLIRNTNRVRSYPGGFMIDKLGTFPSTMPTDEQLAAIGERE
jgi:hypothetical protein